MFNWRIGYSAYTLQLLPVEFPLITIYPKYYVLTWKIVFLSLFFQMPAKYSLFQFHLIFYEV